MSDTFPDVDVLNAYVFPITSWSNGGNGPNLIPLIHQLPNVTKITAFCERAFTWGGVTGILNKLHNTVWEGMCIKMLCEVS
jgi:holliday junction resolvase YEN1